MIHIAQPTANDAWVHTLTSIMLHGSKTSTHKYARDELVAIEVSDPQVLPADTRFPMKQQDLDIINRYIYTGEDEDAVVHEWIKLYYHRAFDQPHSQIEFLIDTLSEDQPIGESQISMWDKNIDQYQDVCPCTQIVWARIKHGKLELHVHANSSDAYKKLLMNILEFISLQHYIAKRINLPVGTYYHLIDSCHIYRKDIDTVNTLLESAP